MILCIFLAIGESWEDFEKKGQDKLLLNSNLRFYSSHFERVYIFSYGKHSGLLLPNVILVPNRFGLHRYLYVFLAPFLDYKIIRLSTIVRSYQLTGAIPGLISKILFRKRLVFNYGYDYAELERKENKLLKSILYRMLEYLVIPFTDSVITTTESLKMKLVNKFQTQVTVIPNSVAVDIFQPKKVKKTINGLYVGRLERQKNLLMLIEAWSNLHPRFKKLKLIFIGDGSMKKKLLEFAESRSVSLTVIPQIQHDRLKNYFNKARIFILPSLIEGHPKTLLEAMSCGLAVVGTNVSGIKDVIKDKYNGLLVEPTSKRIKQAIEKLLHSGVLRQRLGRHARRTILDKYNAENVWTKEISLLKMLSQ